MTTTSGGAADTTELLRKIDRLESIEAVRALAYAYCQGIDRRDEALFRSAWHADAEWVLGPEAVISGIDAILQTAVTGIWPAYSETHHWTSNLRLEVDGDRGTGSCDVDATVRSSEGQWFRASATYDDVYERLNGRWGIVRRSAVMHFNEPLA